MPASTLTKPGLGKKVAWAVVILLVLWIVFWVVGAFNRFVRLDQGAKNQWAQVQTAYQRRLDLIPNVVASVQGFLKQEQAIFKMITDARAAYAGAGTPAAQVAAANQLESVFGRLLVIMEQNPEIKSNQTVQSLIAELEGTENRISVERQRYNDAVRNYKTAVSVFPANTLAGMFDFDQDRHTFFEAAAGAEVAPKVEL